MPRSALSRNSLGMLVIFTFVLTSCAAEQPTESNDAASAPASSTPADTTTNQDDVLVAEVDDPVEFEACQEAEQLDGATVQWLDDVVVEEQRIEGVEAQTVEIEGEKVEIPGAPDIVIPERVGQSGCIIEYPAPGGCLPAVEISPGFMPGYRIPERKLERFELPDGTVLEEIVQDSLEVEAVHVEGLREEQVCQAEPESTQNTQIVASVYRSSMLRHSKLSQTANQDYEGRDGLTSNSGTFINGMALRNYSTNSQTIPSVHVTSDTLESYVMEGTDQTEYAERDEVTAYTTEGDVLFDSEDHKLRSDAATELQAIANDIATRSDEVTIRIEGHTDDLPSQQYADNTELSERRAESVLKWLTDNTDIPAASMTAEGFGDEHPRASNSTDEGRQQNRRVVITVTPKDYDPSIDYEVED